MRDYYKEKFKELRNLEHNWDDYDSIPIDENLLQYAENIITYIENTWINYPLAFLAPISGGGLQIEWENDEKYLELEFTDDYELGYMTILNPRTLSDEIIFNDECKYDDFRTIDKLLNWYIKD